MTTNREVIANERDARYAHVINHTTILIDFRKSRSSIQDQQDMARGIANRHFWGSSDGLVHDSSRYGSGIMLGGNMLNVYHVASIKKGIWIVSSMKSMSPAETRPIATKYVSEN